MFCKVIRKVTAIGKVAAEFGSLKAGMVESADTRDLKSLDSDIVSVRIRLPAPNWKIWIIVNYIFIWKCYVWKCYCVGKS